MMTINPAYAFIISKDTAFMVTHTWMINAKTSLASLAELSMLKS